MKAKRRHDRRELIKLGEAWLKWERTLLVRLLSVRAAAFIQCLICGKLVPKWEVTNRHAASWECLACADETDRIMLDDEWWRVNGPKEGDE